MRVYLVRAGDIHTFCLYGLEVEMSEQSWEKEAERYSQNADYWRDRAEKAEAELVSKDKKLTDYEKELRKLHNYDKTCSTCRYLDENQDCVLGIRCVNYALWQGRIL